MPRRRASLGHPLVIAAGVWVLVLATCLQTRGLLPNELETFVYSKHWIDPEYLAGDWRLGMHPGPRLPFIVLIAPLVMLLPIEQAAVVGAAVGYLLVALALGLLFARLGLSVIEALAVVGVFLMAGQSLAAGDFIFRNFEGKVVAYALVFLALAVAVRGALVLAGALLGAATTMHVLVGGWSALAFAASVAMTARGSPKQWALAASAYVIAALPGALAIVLADPIEARPLPESITAAWVYVQLRVPHHLDPRSFLTPGPFRWLPELSMAFGSLIAASVLVRSFHHRDGRVLVVRFVQATLLPAVIGFAASFVSGGERFLLLYPFRVADTMVLMLAPAALLALILPRLPNAPVAMRASLLIACVAVIGAVAARPRASHQPQPPGFAEVAEFIDKQAPLKQPVLISPHMEYAGYWMQRPVVALWKYVPHDRHGFAEWYHRMVDLAAIASPETPGGRPNRRRLDAFDHLPIDEYRVLARKYGARYLVVRGRDDVRLPIALQNTEFAVYEVVPP